MEVWNENDGSVAQLEDFRGREGVHLCNMGNRSLNENPKPGLLPPLSHLNLCPKVDVFGQRASVKWRFLSRLTNGVGGGLRH